MYDMVVKDNFLDGTHLIQLDELIDNPLFAWFLQKEQIKGTGDGCWFSHMIYATESPRSYLYDLLANGPDSGSGINLPSMEKNGSAYKL